MSRKDKAKRQAAADRMAKSELKKRLLSYSAVAGAALIAAGHAAGGVVYSGPQNITVDSGNPSVGVDFDGGGAEVTIDFSGGIDQQINTTVLGGSYTTGGYSTYVTTGPGTDPYGPPGGYSTWIPGQHVPGQTYTSSQTDWWRRLKANGLGGAGLVANQEAQILSQSQNVGAGGTNYWQTAPAPLASAEGATSHSFYSGGGQQSTRFGNFLGAKGYIGVRFDNGQGLRYGWIQFEGAGDASSGLVIDWAYDDTGAPMHCGTTSGGEPVIPEPSGLALLATGAAGLAALRKKRAA